MSVRIVFARVGSGIGPLKYASVSLTVDMIASSPLTAISTTDDISAAKPMC